MILLAGLCLIEHIGKILGNQTFVKKGAQAALNQGYILIHSLWLIPQCRGFGKAAVPLKSLHPLTEWVSHFRWPHASLLAQRQDSSTAGQEAKCPQQKCTRYCVFAYLEQFLNHLPLRLQSSKRCCVADRGE